VKPAYERFEIREKFNRFRVMDWTRIQEIERHIIAHKQKSVSPIHGMFCFTHHGGSL
jgi:hypothetical protein